MHTLIRCLVLLALCFGGDATALNLGSNSRAALDAPELSEDGVRQPLPESALHDGAHLETSEEEEEESASFVDATPRPQGVTGSTRAFEAAYERPAHAREWVAAVRGPPRGRGTS